MFNGDNYDLWADAVRNGLDAKNKLGFVDGTVTKPKGSEADSYEAVAWRQCTAMVKAWLRNVIDEKLHPSITFSASGTRSVVEYYTHLKSIWDELANYSRIPQCTCGAGEAFTKEKEEEKVHHFIMGLNTALYDQIRSNLLMEDNLASLSRAYALVLREESHKAVTRIREEQAEVAMAIRNGGRRGRGSSLASEQKEYEPPRCNYCNKWYHIEENCWDKLGINGRGRGRGRRGGRGRGSRGTSNTSQTANAATTSEAESSKKDLTVDEIEQLRTLLNTKPEGNEKLTGMNHTKLSAWMLDSGASHHMTGCRELLNDLWKGESSTVGLPDGSTIMASEHGKVAINKRFELKDVLYVPSTNLLRWRLDGVQRDGVYYLTRVDEVAARTDFGEERAWHRRLGHPSRNILPLLNNLLHKNLSFNPEHGPYKASSLSGAHYFLTIVDDHSRSVWVYLMKDKGEVGDLMKYFCKMVVTLSQIMTLNLLFPTMTTKQVNTSASDDQEEEEIIIDNPTATVGGDSSTVVEGESENEEGEQRLGRKERQKFEPAWKKDYICNSPVNFIAAIDATKEPRNYAEAIQKDEWKIAMAKEIDALEKNGTWKIVDLPKGKRPIGCKWVYKIKHKVDGTIERYKARLVAQGYTQIEGVDYHETFAPVAKMTSVSCLLAVAAAKKWNIAQLYVSNAFLHGDLSEEVYMKLPQVFEATDTNKVCRLLKSLYGLKQASRNWFAKLKDALKVSDNAKACDELKRFLDLKFGIKDLGRLKYFLGIDVAHGATGLFLSQRKYAVEIIKEARMEGAKPINTPIPQNHQLAFTRGYILKDPMKYRRLVGRLVYLTITRPDLVYVVHILFQFVHEPRKEHLDAALRVVRYIKGNPGKGIVMSTDTVFQLHGYSDSDWGRCPLTRRSLTGYFVSLGQTPISWRAKKQHTVSKSSAEAEYRAMAAVTSELIWIKSFLKSLGIQHDQPMRVLCDNQAAMHIAKNPVFHDRTKHIEIDFHFIRQHLIDKNIMTSYVRSKEQIADLFTKALGGEAFDYLQLSDEKFEESSSSSGNEVKIMDNDSYLSESEAQNINVLDNNQWVELLRTIKDPEMRSKIIDQIGNEPSTSNTEISFRTEKDYKEPYTMSEVYNLLKMASPRSVDNAILQALTQILQNQQNQPAPPPPSQFPEEDKVKLASHFLVKEADRWWTMTSPTSTLEPGFGWDRFKDLSGHKANECPERKTTTTPVVPERPRGRIFVMSRAEAEAHPDIVTGMLTHSKDDPSNRGGRGRGKSSYRGGKSSSYTIAQYGNKKLIVADLSGASQTELKEFTKWRQLQKRGTDIPSSSSNPSFSSAVQNTTQKEDEMLQNEDERVILLLNESDKNGKTSHGYSMTDI
ncbi:uncharacterized protein LOC141618213 [Silene latifolia]|uniref:uncharacterized protein LOC141618213 n=1 Tax=Silene latifolia TaxID=37657 RepID=UPI003D76DCF7